MTGSESESATVIAYNAKIEFESGNPTAGPVVANGVIYSAPIANGVIYSETPNLFATNNDPPSVISEPILPADDTYNITGNMENNNKVGREVLSSKSLKQGGLGRGFIETKAPIESVKAAVSKFGGIVDWKARRVHSMMERIKPAERTLEEVQEEILQCRKKSEESTEAEFQALNELENTKRRIEELTVALETAQSEEQHATQDSELAKLKLEEIEQEIIQENGNALAKVHLEMSVAEHAAAASELKSVREELEVVRDEFSSIACERDSAVKNAGEALAASKESENALEELTNELVALRELLESSQAAHLEEEEKTMLAAVAKEQDCYKWKKELNDAEDEFRRLNLQILSTEDLKSKVNTASALLSELKAEMIAYMESALKEEISDEQHLQGEVAKSETRTNSTIQSAAIVSAKGELEDVKLNIEKATAEVECLKTAATSLKSVLEEEKSTLQALEAEINKNAADVSVNVDLTNQLKQAAEEADQAKSIAQMAREELEKAKIEAAQAKAESIAMESKILAAQKEVEASNASKMLALSAIKALQETISSETVKEDSTSTVAISLEEYNELSERAREAEEQASIKMTKAISQIEVAKESEAKSLEMLEDANRELVARQKALKAATEKVSEAEEEKLAVEKELRIWREKQEQSDAHESDQVKSPDPERQEPTTDKQTDSPGPEEQEPIVNEHTPTTESDQVLAVTRTSVEIKEPTGEEAVSPAPHEQKPITNEQTRTNESDQEVDIPTTTSLEVKEETVGKADSPAPQGQEPMEKEQTQSSLGRTESLSGSKAVKKKKRSFIPKMLSLLSKQRSSRNKAT